MRYVPLIASVVGIVVFGLMLPISSHFFTAFALCCAFTGVGVWDMVQSRHSLRRNYPILANLRFGLEKVRPEIRQYFLESDTDGTPYNRSKRAVVYQRAKGQLDKRPLGTQQDVYGVNFEWINHSIVPAARIAGLDDLRVTIGGPDCRHPYSLSLLNISAMSLARSAPTRSARSTRAPSSAICPRYRRRRLQPASPRLWRRHHLGDRQRLFRLPKRGRLVLRRRVRPPGSRAASQDGRDQAVAGRQARPWRRAAGAESVA
jgi:hypothetical protein